MMRHAPDEDPQPVVPRTKKAPPVAPRAFVAGATGYTGRAVVDALVERGVDVVAHVRPDSARLEEWRRRFGAAGATVDTTAWDEDAMAATLGRVRPDLLFSLLGTTRKRARRAGASAEAMYRSIDLGLTALLIAACGRAGVAPRFVYLSSTGTGPTARSDYLRFRWLAEQRIRASNLPHVIARPSFITGADREEDRPAERMGAAASDLLLGIAARLGAGRLRERYRSTTADELARALVRHALESTADRVTLEGEALR